MRTASENLVNILWLKTRLLILTEIQKIKISVENQSFGKT